MSPAPTSPSTAALLSEPGEPAARVVLDPRTRRLHGDRVLLSPTGRLLRLGLGGPAALVALDEGRATETQRALGRTLVDAGAAHPLPIRREADDVTVVIPVKDRPLELARCLASLTGDVLVIDDGSQVPVTPSGTRVVRRANGGPAAARNTALPLLDKDFVAFLDSDCVAPPGWLEELRGHFDDPSLGAVAPRVRGGIRSPLDLGPRPATVRPGGEVSYLPTAALLVRRSALTAFDEDLRYGEDVDLVWRMIDAGWQVRYDPRVVVEHTEPTALVRRLARRFHYGTAAAPLSKRHPTRVAHVVLPPWSTAVVLLARRHPLAAMGVAAWSTVKLDRHLEAPAASAAVVLDSVRSTALGLGRALALLGPVGWTRPVLVVAPYLQEWWQRRPGCDPVTYVATALLDQAAYGAGVLSGCVRHRTTVPLRPRWK
ncbi:MAG: mftF [Frankiales bacterium]|nr:mftF [Frankiales bacterium]